MVDPTAPQPTVRPRRPWLAGLLAALTAGLGHLYLGRWRAAAGIPVVVFCGTASIIIVVLLAGGSSLLALGLAGIVFVSLYLLQIVAAVQIAKRSPTEFVPRVFNRWTAYLLWFLVVQVVASLPAVGLRANVIELFEIPSDSMQPTLEPGDFVAIPKIGPNARTPLAVGDLAVFEYPPDPRLNYIKRIAGLPDDTVSVHGNRLAIQGSVSSARCNQPTVMVTDRYGRDQAADCWLETRSDGASWPVFVARAQARGPGADFGPTVVAQDQLLMFGDYRTNSSDSRVWGTVRTDQVLGRPDQIVFSLSRREGPRWDRIGTPLQPR